jgi:hypothetical protein
MADSETSLTAFVEVDISGHLSRLRRRPSIDDLILHDISIPNKLTGSEATRSRA